jgi:hypothetical protein
MSMRFKPVDIAGDIQYHGTDDDGISVDCGAVYPPWAVIRHSDVKLEIPGWMLPQVLKAVQEAMGVPAAAEPEVVQGLRDPVREAVFKDYFADERTTAVREGVTQRSVAAAHGVSSRRVSEWVRAEAEARSRVAVASGHAG